MAQEHADIVFPLQHVRGAKRVIIGVTGHDVDLGRIDGSQRNQKSDEYTHKVGFYDAETGSIRPDISMMSASQLGQLSMIISFVLLHNASEKFNIIRLDEVDNNLDNDNRLRFFSLVYTIMQILNFDQAIIISHNVELDLSNCDLIITRLQNIEQYKALLNSGANIIADFTRAR
jgi:ABC-type cobalamin/Fe3+-siderophores transport system ATPase subunit